MGDENGRDVAAHQGVGALADVDAADVEGQPDAAAGDRQQSDGAQRVIEVRAVGGGDRPRRGDENQQQKGGDRRDRGKTRHRHQPHGLPISPFGRMARNTINATKIAR